jgi:hypothetical protein
VIKGSPGTLDSPSHYNLDILYASWRHANIKLPSQRTFGPVVTQLPRHRIVSARTLWLSAPVRLNSIALWLSTIVVEEFFNVSSFVTLNNPWL